ncbi:unnamed protein product, partial [Chrysoparadoxa australica]
MKTPMLRGVYDPRGDVSSASSAGYTEHPEAMFNSPLHNSIVQSIPGSADRACAEVGDVRLMFEACDEDEEQEHSSQAPDTPQSPRDPTTLTCT